MKPEKMECLSKAKLRYGFPKNIKFHFYSVFWAILQFYQQFHSKIYAWIWYGLILIFFLVISITLPFQIKENSNSKNFAQIGSPEVFGSVIKVLRFCRFFPGSIYNIVFSLTLYFLSFCSICWYRLWQLINFEQNVSFAWFSLKQYSIPPIFYGNDLFDIYLIASKP